MNKFNRRYAAILGVSMLIQTFDAGQWVKLEHRPTNAVWSGTIVWGDEDAMNRRITKFLHTIPWPQEDDPRVQHDV